MKKIEFKRKSGIFESKLVIKINLLKNENDDIDAVTSGYNISVLIFERKFFKPQEGIIIEASCVKN